MKLAVPRGVGVRLALSYALLLGLLIAVAATGLARLDAMNRDFSTIVVDRHARIEHVREIVDFHNEMLRAVQRVLLAHEAAHVERELARLESAKRAIGEKLEHLDHAFLGEDERATAFLAQAHQRNGEYLLNLVKFARLAAAGRRDQARALLDSALDSQLDAARAAMATLANAQAALMHRSQQDAQASHERGRIEVLGLAIAAALIALAVAIAITRGITRPLGNAARLADAVAEGDLTHHIEPRGRDETARLLQALQRMTVSLARLVADVRTSSVSVAGTSRELVAGNAQLTERAEEQASALEQTAATLQQLTATVRRNAEQAGEASRLAHAASASAARAGASVDRAVQRMCGITAASRKIADITHVIDSIAFQTNILALNAAVEAARAGDQGRGFAVVAAEVRGLAQRSATAAKEIGDLIRGSVSEVEDGARLVDEAGRTMGEVVAGIDGVARQVADISGASREQSGAIEQVNRALAEIEQVTQHNVALAEETAAAVESLEQQSRILVEAVDAFRIADTPDTPAPGEESPQKPTARSPAPLALVWSGEVRAAARSAAPRC